MSSQKRVRWLEKKLLAKRIEAKKIEARRHKLFSQLRALNEQYRKGLLSYQEYSALWNTVLSGRTIEEWVTYYNAYAEKLEKEIQALKSKLSVTQREAEKTRIVASAALVFITLMLAIAGAGIFTDIGGITGLAALANYTTTTTSEVNITVYFATALSSNLTEGIQFGSIVAGSTDVNATANYLGASSGSALFINVSEDSNVEVDVCIRAAGDFKDSTGAYTIGIGNMTWSATNITDEAVPPGPFGSIPLNTSFVLAVPEITPTVPEEAAYFRFWLDVPLQTQAGVYNTTTEFKSIQTGTGC